MRQGRVSAIQTIEVEWSKGGDGRMSLAEVPGTEKEWKADLVMLSMGFLGPENYLGDLLDLATDPRTNVEASTSIIRHPLKACLQRVTADAVSLWWSGRLTRDEASRKQLIRT